RTSLRDIFAQSLPSRIMEPVSGSIRRTIQRASVDFPDPDSPTMPSVAPRGSFSETFFTAGVTRAPRPRNPPVRYVFETLLMVRITSSDSFLGGGEVRGGTAAISLLV